MHRRKAYILAVFIALSTAVDVKANDLLISSPKRVDVTSENTLSIVGLRSASASFVRDPDITGASGGVTAEYFVPERVVLSSWMTDKAFAEVVRNRVDGNLTLDAIEAAGIRVDNFKWSSVSDPSVPTPRKEPFDIDPKAIIALTANGGLDFSREGRATSKKYQGQLIALSADVPETITQAYFNAAAQGRYPLSDPNREWLNPDQLLENASVSEALGELLKVDLGRASFGQALVRTSDEAKLTVDKYILDRQDLFLIEFSLTLYDMPVNHIEEVSFRVSCEPNCTAWAMAPIRIMNTEKRSDTASVPSVAAGGVSVGSIFQRNIVYETVRPQITGYGLRESAFSWSLEDEAIAMGSYVFVAAVGVPKDAGKLFLKQSVAVKASSFLLEGDWASTGQRTEEITLQ